MRFCCFRHILPAAANKDLDFREEWLTFKGVLAGLAASALYGIMPVFTKLVLGTGMSAANVVIYRLLLACLFAGAFMKVRRIPMRVEGRQLISLLIFGVTGSGLTMLLLTQSYQFIPSGLATMFHFSYPLFVMIAMVGLFKEKLTFFKVFSALSAFGGIVLMADFSGGLSVKGVMLALASGITYAAFVVASRKSSFAMVPAITVIFYVTLFSSVLFGLPAIISGTFSLPPNLYAWGGLIAISLFCTVGALCLLTIGIRVLGASKASVLNMMEPVTSVICGILFFHEALNFKSGLGCVFILFSTVLTLLESRQMQKKASMQEETVSEGEDTGNSFASLPADRP